MDELYRFRANEGPVFLENMCNMCNFNEILYFMADYGIIEKDIAIRRKV